MQLSIELTVAFIYLRIESFVSPNPVVFTLIANRSTIRLIYPNDVTRVN